MAPTKDELNALQPLRSMRGYDGWTKAQKAEMEAITVRLYHAAVNMVKGRLAVGKELLAAQEALASKLHFSAYLRIHKFSRSTAYDIMEGYKRTATRLPEPYIDRAIVRGMPMIGSKKDKPLGRYTEVVSRLPAPRDTSNIQAMDAWLDSAEEATARKEKRKAKILEMTEPADTDLLLKETFQYVNRNINKLPSRGKARRNFLETLTSMLMAHIGISTSLTFSPEAPPAHFTAGRGRPSLSSEEDLAS